MSFRGGYGDSWRPGGDDASSSPVKPPSGPRRHSSQRLDPRPPRTPRQNSMQDVAHPTSQLKINTQPRVNMEKQLLDFANSVAAQTLHHVKLAQASDSLEAKKCERDRGKDLHTGSNHSPWTEVLETEVQAAIHEYDELKKVEADCSGKTHDLAKNIARAFEEANDSGANQRVQELSQEVKDLKKLENDHYLKVIERLLPLEESSSEVNNLRKIENNHCAQINRRLIVLEEREKELDALRNDLHALQQNQFSPTSAEFVTLKNRITALETDSASLEEKEFQPLRKFVKEVDDYQKFLEEKVQDVVASNEERSTEDASKATESTPDLKERLSNIETAVQETTDKANQVHVDLHGQESESSQDESVMAWILRLFEELKEDGLVKGPLNELRSQFTEVCERLKKAEEEVRDHGRIVHPRDDAGNNEPRNLLEIFKDHEEMSHGMTKALSGDCSKLKNRLDRFEQEHSHASSLPSSDQKERMDKLEKRLSSASRCAFTVHNQEISNTRQDVQHLQSRTQTQDHKISSYQTALTSLAEKIDGCTRAIKRIDDGTAPNRTELEEVLSRASAAQAGVTMLQKRFDNLTTNHVVEAMVDRMKRYFPLHELNNMKFHLGKLLTDTTEIRKAQETRIDEVKSSIRALEDARENNEDLGREVKMYTRVEEVSTELDNLRSKVEKGEKALDDRRGNEEKFETDLDTLKAYLKERLDNSEATFTQKNDDIRETLASLEDSSIQAEEIKTSVEELQTRIEAMPDLKTELQIETEDFEKKIEEFAEVLKEVKSMADEHEKSIADYDKQLRDKADIHKLDESIASLRKDIYDARQRQPDLPAAAATPKAPTTASKKANVGSSSRSTSAANSGRPSFKYPSDSPASKSSTKKDTNNPNTTNTSNPSPSPTKVAPTPRPKTAVRAERSPSPIKNVHSIKRRRSESASPPIKAQGRPQPKRNKFDSPKTKDNAKNTGPSAGKTTNTTSKKNLNNESNNPVIISDNEE
ncbi:MAG: hypothetical protein M1831_004912 [Alyxoria varia]|nr:MAG: hypothetical protein M1831_004912 [Alyxoria varia]